MNYEVKFKLSDLGQERYDRLKGIIPELACPVCQSKTNFVQKENQLVITPICHEKFARHIGNLPSIWNITSLSIKIRGEVIDVFCVLEQYIDAIIKKLSFDSEEEYYKYMDILTKGDLSMKAKKAMFKNLA